MREESTPPPVPMGPTEACRLPPRVRLPARANVWSASSVFRTTTVQPGEIDGSAPLHLIQPAVKRLTEFAHTDSQQVSFLPISFSHNGPTLRQFESLQERQISESSFQETMSTYQRQHRQLQCSCETQYISTIILQFSSAASLYLGADQDPSSSLAITWQQTVTCISNQPASLFAWTLKSSLRHHFQPWQTTQNQLLPQ